VKVVAAAALAALVLSSGATIDTGEWTYGLASAGGSLCGRLGGDVLRIDPEAGV